MVLCLKKLESKSRFVSQFAFANNIDKTWHRAVTYRAQFWYISLFRDTFCPQYWQMQTLIQAWIILKFFLSTRPFKEYTNAQRFFLTEWLTQKRHPQCAASTTLTSVSTTYKCSFAPSSRSSHPISTRRGSIVGDSRLTLIISRLHQKSARWDLAKGVR